MTSRTIITATHSLLVLEPTVREYDEWNLAALASRKLTSAWIPETLDSASAEQDTQFTVEDFKEGDRWQSHQRCVFDFNEFPESTLSRLRAAAGRATYPVSLLYKVTGRRKQSRHCATLLLAPWAHATLTRAANIEGATFPGNVIPFPTR